MSLQFLRLVSTTALLAAFSSSFAQINIGTTDASNGSINGYAHQFRMDLAVTGVWSDPAPSPGVGIYDPALWAVVYKFQDFASADCGIVPHPSGCPIVILVQGNISISLGIPQRAGGFPGGLGSTGAPGSAGLGLGGGSTSVNPSQGGGSASYGTQASSNNSFPPGDPYGNPAIIPLVGGSGGGSYYNTGGGYGGGAALIACRNTINVVGAIGATAGGYTSAAGGPSGGAIRLVGNTITGNGGGFLVATGGGGDAGSGGLGRIRLEANTFGPWGTSQPAPSLATVGATAKIWPSNTDPKVDILSVNGIAAPADPGAAFQSPDVQLNSAGSFTVAVETRNVPTDGSWTVSVRGAPRSGAATVYNCTFLNGNQALSTWTTTVPFSEGLQVLQARAKKN